MPLARGRTEPSVTLEGLCLEPPLEEVLRYLGYPAGAAAHVDVAARAAETIHAARDLARPRGTYTVYPVLRQTRTSIELGGGARFTGRIGEFLANAQRVAVFLATAGPEVVAMAEAAFRRRDTLSGLIYHALGAALAEAVVERLIADLHGLLAPEEALTLRFSPGYCGTPLAQQRTLFTLVDAAGVGVELLPSLIMKPIKSVSGLIGIGPRDAITAYANPCGLCPLTDCRMRR